MFSTTNVQRFKKTQNILKENICFSCHFTQTTKNCLQNDRNHTYFIPHRHDFITQTRKKKVFYQKTFFLIIKKEHKETSKAKADFYVVKHIKQYVNF